ncbi:MAG: ComF family protein [Omnitrophica WOR_2 bacterium]
MINSLNQLKWKIDVVVPVPLGVARLAERGYNQAALLARPVSLGMGLSYSSKALFRIRETRSQVELKASERKSNVKGAFQARSELVDGKHVLVIDDVATTGSTLGECARALLEAGAAQVVGFTLARASYGL